MTLQYAIERGLKEEASRLTKDRVAAEDPLAIINEDLIPALDIVRETLRKRNAVPASASDECGCRQGSFCGAERDDGSKRRRAG
ncbi:MAG: B12-binding domain-containing protein [Sellimonas intestinalis]